MIQIKDRLHSIFSFSVNRNEIWNRIRNRSMQFCRLNNIQSEALQFSQDERDTFRSYLDSSVSELMTILARYMRAEEITSPSGEIKDIADNTLTYIPFCQTAAEGDAVDFCNLTFALIVTDNYDANVLSTLPVCVTDYLVARCLEQYYGKPFGGQDEKAKINSCLHFRRRSAAQKVRPLL